MLINGWTIDSSMSPKLLLNLLTIPTFGRFISKNLSKEDLFKLVDDRGYNALFYSFYSNFTVFSLLIEHIIFDLNQEINGEDIL